MGLVLKKVLDAFICLFNQCGCLRHDKRHSLREFNRQYRVCGEIGSGGFGRVYKAYRLVDGLPVAVKSIRHKRINGWTWTERRMIPTEICFIEECQDVKGVVRLIGWFVNRRGFLIVMERPTNFMDLFDLISTFGCVEERMARGLFVQIVDTVVELYKKHSVIHRDIKDENVVVDLDSGVVWLVDFGAAELLERAKKQRFQGTMSYSPPEVFSRDCFLPLEGTVWSLGVLLYLLVVGKPPFRNELQICTGKLRFPRTLSPECRALIHRCLCPTPEGRISLEELQQSEWVQNSGAMDTFTSDFEAQWRRRRRKRHGSLNSNILHAPSDDDEDSDEDCSYRTEVGAVPGPLTIPPMCRGISVAHRSSTISSSFVEQNSQSPMGANAFDDQTAEQKQSPPFAVVATTADIRPSSVSSSSSLALSELGFETAPEYDESKYASLISSGSTALSCTNWFFDKNATFRRPNAIFDNGIDPARGQGNCSPAANSVPFVQIALWGGSAVSSFCSFCSSSSDRETRRNSFTSDDSFNSSTTYFSANSHENAFLHLNSLCDAIGGDTFQANLRRNAGDEENEEEDEMTLRTEQPKIMLREWEGKMSEDGQEEWDETIREDNDFSVGKGQQQNKEGGEAIEEQFEEDELLEEEGQFDEDELLEEEGQFDEDELLEEDEQIESDGLLEEGELLEEDKLFYDEQLLTNDDEPEREIDQRLEADELSANAQRISRKEQLGEACSSSAFCPLLIKGRNEQLDEAKTDENTRELKKRLDHCGFWDEDSRGDEQKAQRKGGNRYRRRKGTALAADEPGEAYDRRKRRMTSPPPQQLLNLLYH